MLRRWSARLVQRLVQAGASIDGGVGGEATLVTAAFARWAQGVCMIPQLVALGARNTTSHSAMSYLATFPANGRAAITR